MKNSFVKVFTNKRILITLLLGFSSGLPLPLVWGTLKGWLASEKVDLKTIGLFSLVTLPYSLKFIWAPLIDRYVPPFLNRRTGWMVITQGLMLFSIIGMGLTDPVNQTFHLALVGIWVAFLSATQDIVIDAYRVELLQPDELGPGAAVAVTGARIGLLTSGSLAFILSDHMSWKYVYCLMGVLGIIGMVTAVFAPAPMNDAKPPKSLNDAIINPFKIFFQHPRAIEILLFIFIFKIGDVFAGEMLTPFLIKTGFNRSSIGILNKGLGMTATIVGSLVGGGFVSKLGLWRGLMVFGCLQPVANLSFVALTKVGLSYSMLATAIGIDNFCTGLSTTAFVAFLMSLCDKRYTATQFALLSSLMAVSRPFVGSVTGVLAEKLGWTGYFSLSVALAAPGLLLLLKLKSASFQNETNPQEAKS